MLVGLFLSALAGCAAAQLARGMAGTVAVVSLGAAAALLEGWAVPISLLAPPACSPIYESVGQLPERAVIAELPLGDPYRDVQYMFCSTRHWRKLVNGYSGVAPADYSRRASALQGLWRDPEAAWMSLVDSGATDVVVHEDAWQGAKGRRVSAWLEEHGAVRRATAGTDVLYSLAAPGLPSGTGRVGSDQLDGHVGTVTGVTGSRESLSEFRIVGQAGRDAVDLVRGLAIGLERAELPPDLVRPMGG